MAAEANTQAVILSQCSCHFERRIPGILQADWMCVLPDVDTLQRLYMGTLRKDFKEATQIAAAQSDLTLVG